MNIYALTFFIALSLIAGHGVFGVVSSQTISDNGTCGDESPLLMSLNHYLLGGGIINIVGPMFFLASFLLPEKYAEILKLRQIIFIWCIASLIWFILGGVVIFRSLNMCKLRFIGVIFWTSDAFLKGIFTIILASIFMHMDGFSTVKNFSV